MTIEEYAKLVATLKHFAPKNRAEVLARMRVGEAEHAKEERRWTQAMVDAASDEDTTVVEAFGLAFATEQRRLREEKPPLSSLGALPVALGGPSGFPPVSPVVAGSSPEPTPAPAAASRPASDPQSTRTAAVGLPSYMAHAVGPAREPETSSVDETVIGGAPTAKDLPFGGRRPPPPSTPVLSSPDAGGTLMVPLPAVPLSKSAAPAFDPDVTHAPFANPLPAIPFSGTTSPERLREMAGPPASGPSEEAGETVPLPSPDELRELLQAAQADLSLQDYAVLRAGLSTHGEESSQVLARFGLSPLQKQAIQEKYFERFREDPALRERFEALLREELRKVNRGSSGPKR